MKLVHNGQEISVQPTFTATIYVGTKEGRTFDPNAKLHSISEIENICQEYCNARGLCVTVTTTRFVYTGGYEFGAAVGLINYPRFPKENKDILDTAIELARILKKSLGQLGVSVVTPQLTYWIDED